MAKRNDKKPIPVPRKRSFTIWSATGILFALALGAYCNSFTVPMVFDDMATIQANDAVRFGLIDWQLLRARAVLYLTFTLNFLWTGQTVWSYHLVNFLLHLLNGFLVLRVAEHLFRCIEIEDQSVRLYAFFAAAFFLVHPVQTESVTYISSRSELLSTFFYLIGFWIFVAWPRERVGFLCSLMVAIPFFFGLGSKETVITLPATLFVCDFLFWSGGRIRPVLSRWRFYVIYVFGGGAAIYYILNVAQVQTLSAQWEGRLSPLQYLMTQFRVIVRYIQVVFLPVGLNLDYDFIPSTSLDWPVIVSFICLVGLACLAWMLRRRAPVFAFSILWFFITLSPTSSVVPLPDIIFEHRLYLPLAGVCLSFLPFMQIVYRHCNTS